MFPAKLLTLTRGLHAGAELTGWFGRFRYWAR
jgi:hypothetical protein